MVKKKISIINEDRLITEHISLEKKKFFAGLIIILVSISLMIIDHFFKWNLPNNIYWGIIAGAFLASSTKIKSYKDILGLI